MNLEDVKLNELNKLSQDELDEYICLAGLERRPKLVIALADELSRREMLQAKAAKAEAKAKAEAAVEARSELMLDLSVELEQVRNLQVRLAEVGAQGVAIYWAKDVSGVDTKHIKPLLLSDTLITGGTVRKAKAPKADNPVSTANGTRITTKDTYGITLDEAFREYATPEEIEQAKHGRNWELKVSVRDRAIKGGLLTPLTLQPLI